MPDFGLAQASCAIKVICDREQKGLRSITISLDDCYWPILLKKSAIVCASEKYASEIEIFTVGRGFRTRISRSSVQKRRFHQSMIRQFGQTDFFNRIGRFLPVATSSTRYLSRHLINTAILIHRRTPILAAVTFLANPSICHQVVWRSFDS